MRRQINVVGKTFGKLTVLEQDGKYCFCQCSCSCNVIRAATGNVKNGSTKSCGCLYSESKITHGQSGSKEYVAWSHMKRRCYDPHNPRYKNYGGRGVTAHDDWINDFQAFYNHIGPAPSPQHSVDRIKNHLGYKPGNVKWSTSKDQANNRGGY